MTVIRAGICAIIAFAVAAHGAVEAWSQFIVVTATAALFVYWAVGVYRDGRAEIRWNPLLWPLLLITLVALAQLVFGLSAYPYLTKVALIQWTAGLLLFFLSLQVFPTPEQARPLVWFLLILGFAVALFGIVQHLTFNGKLYWIRELRFGGVPFGPYVNRNHFAGLMELIIPLGLALIFLRGLRRDKLPLVGLFTLLPIGALFLAASRGGIVSLFFQLTLLALLVWVLPSGRRRLALAAGFLVVAGIFLFWLDAGRVFDRFTEFAAEEVARDRRFVMARDTWQIFLDHPVAGTGLGTLVAVYPQYESFYDGKIVQHAHNDYVEILAETGVAGGVAILLFLAILLGRSLTKLEGDRPLFAVAARLGAVVACAGMLLHSLVDFNLHLPSHGLLFLVLAGVATSDAPSTAVNVWNDTRPDPEISA
jgi:O-antigen ligase